LFENLGQKTLVKDDFSENPEQNTLVKDNLFENPGPKNPSQR